MSGRDTIINVSVWLFPFSKDDSKREWSEIWRIVGFFAEADLLCWNE